MNKNYYTTTDFQLAVVISLFYPLDSIDRTNPTKVVFSFKRDAGLDRVIESYWKKELTIEPQTLFFQFKSFKTRLYERL